MERRKFFRIVSGVLTVTGIMTLIACSGATTSSVDSGSRPSDPSEPATATLSIDQQHAKRLPRSTTSSPLQELARRSIELDKTALALCAGSAADLSPGSFTYLNEPAEVLSVVSSDVVQVNFVSSDRIAFVVTDAESYQVGKSYKFGLVQAVKHQQYQTVLGSGSSGVVVKKVSQSEWDRAVREARETIAADNTVAMVNERDELTAKLDSMKPESWTAGKFETVATFVSADSDKVTLLKDDGETVDVPLDRLDESSRSKALSRAATVSRWRTRIKQLDRLLEK